MSPAMLGRDGIWVSGRGESFPSGADRRSSYPRLWPAPGEPAQRPRRPGAFAGAGPLATSKSAEHVGIPPGTEPARWGSQCGDLASVAIVGSARGEVSLIRTGDLVIGVASETRNQ